MNRGSYVSVAPVPARVKVSVDAADRLVAVSSMPSAPTSSAVRIVTWEPAGPCTRSRSHPAMSCPKS